MHFLAIALDTTELQNKLQASAGFDASSLSGTSLFIWLVVGLIGTGYFIYGKKQQRYVPLFAGIGLGIYPLFVTTFWPQLLVGIALIVAPFVIRE